MHVGALAWVVAGSVAVRVSSLLPVCRVPGKAGKPGKSPAMHFGAFGLWVDAGGGSVVKDPTFQV